MAAEEYELATAYVAILPSLRGFGKALEREIVPASSKAAQRMGNSLNKAASGLGGVLSRSIRAGTSLLMRGFTSAGSALSRIVMSSGRLFSQTITTGLRAATNTLAAGIAAVTGQLAVGGFTRALGLNEAEAKLSALGYTARELSGILDTAAATVDGTAYALNESATAATQFLAAGVEPGKDLLEVLENTVKLADMSGASLSDMGSIMAKNAASGVVQWEDLVQLQDRGIGLSRQLASHMGVSVTELRKLASEGQLSFKEFNDAIAGIQFDSALYASKNVRLAFRNVRAQISKIGASLWLPIIDGLAPMLVNIREGLMDLQGLPMFTDFINMIQTNLATAMAMIGDAIENIVKFVGDGDKVRGFFEGVGEGVDDFKSKIRGVEGGVIGLGIAISSRLLSQIPLIGGLFGRVGIGVGILGGVLVQAYRESDRFQDALGGLGDRVRDLYDSFSIGDGTFAETVGDSFGRIIEAITSALEGVNLDFLRGISFDGILESISTNVSSFISTVFTEGDRITTAIGSLWATISETFSQATGGDVNFGEWLGEMVVKGIELAAATLESIVPLLASLIEAVAGIITSDAGQAAIKWLVDIAQYLAENEEVLKWMIITIGGLFVAKKLIDPFFVLLDFFGMFGGGIGRKATRGGGILSKLSKGFNFAFLIPMITGIAAASAALTSALPAILGGIASVGAIAGAVMLLIGLADYLGGFDALRSFGSLISEFILGSIGLLQDVWMSWADFAIEIFEKIAESLTNVTESFGGALADYVEKMGESINSVVEAITPLLSELAENGVESGKGALSAATGITALAGALALLGGGSFLSDLGSGLGSLWTSFTSAITGDDTSQTGKIMELANALDTINHSVEDMPAVWESTSMNAAAAGARIIENLGNGMLIQLQTIELELSSAIATMMDNLQAEINSNPLSFDIRADRGIGNVGSSGSSTYNSNYNVNVNNGSVLQSLARSARGY